MHGQAYRAVKEAAPTETVDTATAVAFLKEHTREKFDETIELHVRLGIDPSKSDQAVRGTVNFPSGAAKQQKIVVFTKDTTQQEAAQKAGASATGGEGLIESILKQGNLDADITIATPDMMPKVAKAAKILGPKGLMPNPKTGTVSDDPIGTIKQLHGGKLAFKMDQLGNIHLAVGKASWDASKLTENIAAALQAIKDARPASAKGEFLRSITLKTTMSPAIRVTA